MADSSIQCRVRLFLYFHVIRRIGFTSFPPVLLYTYTEPFPVDHRYDYKNSIANGCFFNLGARLARYLNNDTCQDWAEKTWDWMAGVGYISDDWRIFDGAHVQQNCTEIVKAQFVYNNAVLLLGAAHLWNHSETLGDDKGSTRWATRLDGLLNGTFRDFFPNNTAYEPSCEPADSCNTDMVSFKGYAARWMTQVAQIAPWTADRILPVLRHSAEAAVKVCTGGPSGRECGFSWVSGVFDGSVGAGQTMNVLGAVSSLLLNVTKAPVTNTTGGTSGGDANAGSNSVSLLDPHVTMKPVTTADKAGAGIVTGIMVLLATGAFWWIAWNGGDESQKSASASMDGVLENQARIGEKAAATHQLPNRPSKIRPGP